jgi:membrane-associated protein
VLALTLVEKIVNWIEPAFAVAGYEIIAACVLMERSIFIGLIVPGDLILALGGVFASQHKLYLAWVIVIGTVSAIAGESIGFYLGRRFGDTIIRKVPFAGDWLAERVAQSEEFFKRRGGWTVAVGRYATAAGAFIPFTAGAGRMSYRTFLLFDVPAIVIWATGISIFGYSFGQHLPFIDKVLSRFGYAMLGLLVIFFGGRFLYKRWKERRKQRSSSRSS